MTIRGMIIRLCRAWTAAPERHPLHEDRAALLCLTAALNDWHIDVLRARAVGRSVRTVLAAHVAGTDEFRIPTGGRHIFGINLRSSLFIKPCRPVELFYILSCVQVLSRSTVK